MYVSFCLEVLLGDLNKLIALCFHAYGQTFFAKKTFF